MQAQPKKRATIVVAVAAGLALFLSGIAIAGSLTDKRLSGGALVQTKISTNSGDHEISASKWTDVHTMDVDVTVPSGKKRLVVATFNAESRCTADGKAWCALRIIAEKSGQEPIELYPRSGDNFAFDSENGEVWEGNSAVRSLKLGSGNWSIQVQGQSTGPGSMTLDDMHLQVEVYKG